MLLAVLALAVTIVHARQSRAFEERALTVTALVVRAERVPGRLDQHVTVGFHLDGRTVLGRAPVIDPRRYALAEEVEVLYDPADPERVLLDEERYNASGPGLLWGAVLVAGLLTGGMGWWWVQRCLRTAASPGAAFAMEAIIGPARPRWWNRRRPWVTLRPLHGTEPVGRYPLMVGVELRDGSDGSDGPDGPDGPDGLGAVTAVVKGSVRDGGLVVARCGERILWPRGRLRS